VGETTAAGSPPPDVPWTDPEQPGGVALRDVDCVERLTKFGRSR